MAQAPAGTANAPRGRPGKRRPELLGMADLKSAWRSGRCGHTDVCLVTHDLDAILLCSACGMQMVFTLLFGRPRTFDVSTCARGGSDWSPVGRAPVDESRRFLLDRAPKMMVPDFGGRRRPHPRLSDELEAILTDTLTGGARPEPAETADFAAAWRGIDCDHGPAVCNLYGADVLINCPDCRTVMVFRHAGGDMFDVCIDDRQSATEWYGHHGAGAVIDMVRESVDTVLLPDMIADPMSADPDRDARRLVRVVSLLERHGLLRRRARSGGASDRYGLSEHLAERLSAAACSRSEFARRARRTAAAMRADGARLTHGGKPISMRRAFETVRLLWTHWFEGVGVDVVAFNPMGMTQYCVRCGFSTLDDDGAGAGHWRAGCPECGYDGYLLGLDG